MNETASQTTAASEPDDDELQGPQIPGNATQPRDDAEQEALRQRVVAALKSCYDPEIPVDIWELGLIYGIDIDDASFVEVTMTLTSPMCPVAGSLPPEVEAKVNAVEGASGALVEVSWDPPWNPEMMSEEAKLTLGF